MTRHFLGVFLIVCGFNRGFYGCKFNLFLKNEDLVAIHLGTHTSDPSAYLLRIGMYNPETRQSKLSHDCYPLTGVPNTT